MAAWATPAARDTQGQRGAAANARKGNPLDTLPNQMAVYGQAAPASSNTHGSRQGLSEPSQQNWQTFAPWTNNRGMTPHRQVVKALVQGSKAKTQMLTVDQVFAEEIKKQELWPTPEGMAGGKTSRGGNRKGELLLNGMVKQWATPQASDHIEGRRTDLDSNQKCLGRDMKQWATPRTPTGGPESAQRKQELGRTTSGGGDLASQASGKLNPRWVETLMGLPIGWTMPSCIRPVTTAPTSCDSSATALCRPSQSEPSDFLLAS
jgi:hypothetical protein